MSTLLADLSVTVTLMMVSGMGWLALVALVVHVHIGELVVAEIVLERTEELLPSVLSNLESFVRRLETIAGLDLILGPAESTKEDGFGSQPRIGLTKLRLTFWDSVNSVADLLIAS